MNQALESPPDVITVDSIDQFVALTCGWHAGKIATLKQLIEVPEGSVFQVGDDEVTMTGDILAGFKFGVEMALMQIDQLPFAAEVEDAAQPAG